MAYTQWHQNAIYYFFMFHLFLKNFSSYLKLIKNCKYCKCLFFISYVTFTNSLPRIIWGVRITLVNEMYVNSKFLSNKKKKNKTLQKNVIFRIKIVYYFFFSHSPINYDVLSIYIFKKKTHTNFTFLARLFSFDVKTNNSLQMHNKNTFTQFIFYVSFNFNPSFTRLSYTLLHIIVPFWGHSITSSIFFSFFSMDPICQTHLLDCLFCLVFFERIVTAFFKCFQRFYFVFDRAITNIY